MGARTVLNWLEDRLRRAWTGDLEDLDDWLAGNDGAITGRENRRRIDLLTAAGGEVA